MLFDICLFGNDNDVPIRFKTVQFNGPGEPAAVEARQDVTVTYRIFWTMKSLNVSIRFAENHIVKPI